MGPRRSYSPGWSSLAGEAHVRADKVQSRVRQPPPASGSLPGTVSPMPKCSGTLRPLSTPPAQHPWLTYTPSPGAPGQECQPCGPGPALPRPALQPRGPQLSGPWTPHLHIRGWPAGFGGPALGPTQCLEMRHLEAGLSHHGIDSSSSTASAVPKAGTTPPLVFSGTVRPPDTS